MVGKLISKMRLKRAFPSPAVRRHLRQRAGLTQQDIAKVLGTDRASVARYELGTREPRGEILKRYSELLDALTLELVGKSGGPA